MKSITPQELHQKLQNNEKIQLIDVREAHELAVCTIGGEPIPMGDILSEPTRIKKDCPVIIHCRSGQRAASVIDALERHYAFDNLYNLAGGIIAYAEQVDKTLEIY